MQIGILYSIYQNVEKLEIVFSAVNCLTIQRVSKEPNSLTIAKMREYLNRLETDRWSDYDQKLS